MNRTSIWGHVLVAGCLLGAPAAAATLNRFQTASLTAIQFEIDSQGKNWANGQANEKPESRGFYEDLIIKFKDKAPFQAPKEFLKDSWPYGSKSAAEPPMGGLMFPAQINDLRNKELYGFVLQLYRYLTSLGAEMPSGEASAVYTYAIAARLEKAEYGPVAEALRARYGGGKSEWGAALPLAQQGINDLIRRAVPVLVKEIQDRVTQVSARSGGDDDTLVTLTVLRTLAKGLERDKDKATLFDQLDMIAGAIMPLAQRLKDKPLR